MQLAADSLHRVLSWVWAGRKSHRPLVTAFRKFVAMSATIDPDFCGNLTYRELAAKMGCTRAILSRHSLAFSDELGGLKFRRSRPASARQRMREAALGHAPNRRGRKTATEAKGRT